MINKKINIGIDLDDTIWNLLDLWLEIFRERYDIEIYPEDITSWDIENFVPQESKQNLFDILFEDETWDRITLKDNCYSVLKEWVDNPKVNVYVVTATSPRIINTKVKKLFELLPFLNEENLIIAKHKQLVNVDILIDDNPNFFTKDANYTPILFTAPHNLNCDKKCVRCENWGDVKHFVDKYITRCMERRNLWN